MIERRTLNGFAVVLAVLAGITSTASKQCFAEEGVKQESGSSDAIEISAGFVAGPVGRYGRSAIHSDPLEYQLTMDELKTPEDGAFLCKGRGGGDLCWAEISAGKNGWFESKSLRGGYLYASLASDADRIMILEASGHSLVYVNGTPRGGDVYSYGWIMHPVFIRKGVNELLFRVSRGRVRAKLTRPEAPFFFTKKDMTLPDLIKGSDDAVFGAVRVVNATEEPVNELTIRCSVDGAGYIESTVPVIGPMTSRKVGFLINSSPSLDQGKTGVHLTLVSGAGKEQGCIDFDLDVRSPQDCHKSTFISRIDGSVQYYSVSPGDIAESTGKPALFLTLHGASVEAAGQARCYKAKDWGHVVAPTNRRPYGFDWEDWGRLDAMEVLGIAEKRFGTDPMRTYLTGHSMGGHGVWQVGVTYPARFAAIAPSAGWYSFWSYAGKEEDPDQSPMEELFARASNPSDTLALSRNYLHHGIYVLHGENDDNVPVGQARFMREHLAGFHADFAYYERPGAGHWWGNDCCDWPPLFAFLESHNRPTARDKKSVEFYTANPGISARSFWACIHSQAHCLKISSIHITQDVKERSFKGTTENVAVLALDLDQLDPGEEVSVELDEQLLEGIETPAGTDRLWLSRVEGTWKTSAEPSACCKGPHRCGTFKDAYDNSVLFVYSTGGTPGENAWSYDKARYDAETFWYRGNGSVDVVPDTEFDPGAEPDRNVLIYGNADTCAVWQALLGKSPVIVRRGLVSVGERALEGNDLGCCFIRPRQGSDIASVGVVGGTGLHGMKAANANMCFISGSGFPDLLVFGADMLTKHFDGVRVVGFFGNDWSVENGEMAWQE